ncbi:anti-sigma factor family protein [Syntrophomonas wolfei]|uniref:Anti-sigma-W factor RsiW n=1 Tax=Syntrophomonas wolfei subsp. wolfei (strain DSM 2245B / Goettingen) TaxID=335541 RepID=Q0B0L8_SYNWW|nr:zf-HC2 domain-containing protein [Syntrophomonas wolfei]ABI67486.1 putative transmembrane anti-sigma factor [Syntrophomonas wolfei subsp. wolfei str. Goettingen G311]
MKCNEAREFFSPWIDHEMEDAEREALQLHLDSCPDCQHELADWERISALLRESLAEAAEERTAPPELTRAVMITLREQGQPKRLAGWKKAAAGIAAALALYLGSSGLLWTPLWQVANKDPAVNTDPVQQTTKQQIAEQPGEKTPGNNAITPAGKQDNKSSPMAPQGMSKPAVKNNPTAPAGPENPNIATVDTGNPTAAPVFLSKERVLVSTIYKLVPYDADQAKAQQEAQKIAAAAGASVQLLGQQLDGQRSATVLKFSCPVETAEQLKQELLGLGSRLSLEENRQDLTSRFNDSLEQYRMLSAQAATVHDKEQSKELEIQIKALEKQLNNWDKEAARESIVLWLEI